MPQVILVQQPMMNNQSARIFQDVAAPDLHQHWHSLDKAPVIVHIVVGLFVTTVGVVAVIGNILVVLTCVRHKDLRTRSNLLIINLAVGDLLMCTIDFPLLAVASFLQTWPFGPVVCRLYAFLTAVAGLVTINTLGCISADRYWAVVWRTSPRQQPPKYITALVVTGVWVYAVAWAVCPILGWGDYVLDGIRTTCTFDYLTRSWSNRAFVLAMIGGNFVLPFFVMLFSYTRIWRTICEVKQGLQNHPGRVLVGLYSSNQNKYCDNKLPIDPTGEQKYNNLHHCADRPSVALSSAASKEKIGPWFKNSSVIVECVNNGAMVKAKKCGSKKEKKSLEFSSDKASQHSRTSFIFCRFKQGHGEREYRHPFSHLQAFRSADNWRTVNNPCQFHTMDKTSINRTISSPKHERETKSKYHQITYSKSASSHFKSRIETSHCRTNGFNNTERKVAPNNHSTATHCRQAKCVKSKLFLKQHRYRLHCELKTMKIMMYLLFAFIVSWFPYVVVSMIGLFGDSSRITYLTSVFPSLVAKSSMVFNPILYSISHPKVRKRIYALFCKTNKEVATTGSRHRNTRLSSSCSISR